MVVMAFADDLALFVPGSLAEVQRALLLIDHFFRLFGVDLNPSKSIVMKVGGKAAEAQWQPEERLWVERDGGRKELRRAGRHEGVPYLGAKMQADGKWGAAERDIRRKVEGWCARVERSSLTLGQASRVLLSAVGGAVQYAAQAMPLSDECLRAIDRRVGRAVGRKAGLSKWLGGGGLRMRCSSTRRTGAWGWKVCWRAGGGWRSSRCSSG